MVPAGVPESLPFDLDTEQCVLGSILRDPRCLPEVASHLRPEDFYAPRHQRMFRLMEELEQRSPGHCDVVSVGHEQERLKLSEELGGTPYLRELMASVPSIAFLENHIRIVRDLAVKRELIHAADRIRRVVEEDAEDSVDQLVEEAQSQVFRVGERLVGEEMISARQLVDENLDRLLKHDGSPQGLETGFLDLDECQGFRPGDLVVLAARPGMGKTALALNVLERVAVERGRKVLMFSLEMPGDQLILRMLSSHARIPHDSLRRGRLGREERERLTISASKLRNSGVFVDESSQPSLAQMRGKSRRLKRDHGLDLIIVDYLQLLHARAESRQVEISLISRTLKSIARDLRVPVLALSQLNRKAEDRTDKRPLLSDLRESGAIEQDADMVLLLMREEYYEPTEDNRDKAQVFIAKNRHGSTGDFQLRFTKKLMRFENFTPVTGGRPEPVTAFEA